MDSLLERYDAIIIRDLVLTLSIGIYDHEKQNPQNVVINIKAYVPKEDIDNAHSIQDALSYEILVKDIAIIAAQKHYELVEELATAIASLCMKYALTQAVAVKIEKPDIIKETKSVGIEILRYKHKP